jgi:hypothetical protein
VHKIVSNHETLPSISRKASCKPRPHSPNTSPLNMAQTTESILSLVNMTIACGNWQECIFFKYKIPTELRIQIWELYFSNEPPPPTARYRTPNLIKALRMKERPELYHEALQCFWAVTTFIYSSHSFRNFGVSGDRNQLASIQNLTCYIE